MANKGGVATLACLLLVSEVQSLKVISYDKLTNTEESLNRYNNWDANYLSQAIMSNDIDDRMQEEAAVQIQESFEHTVLNKKIDQMNEELDIFSRTQDPEHWQAARELKNELNDAGNQQSSLLVNTKQLFEKGFQFENVAQYDHVITMLSEVSDAQDNLNENQENDILMDKFIGICKKVRK